MSVVLQCDSYGRPFDKAGDYEEMQLEETLQQFSKYKHAAHAMIYTVCLPHEVEKLRKSHTVSSQQRVLMVLRFDGSLGFPGGLLDGNETPEDGLNREMLEEIALDMNSFRFVRKDHVMSHVNRRKEFVTHFYAKCVEPKDYAAIELDVLKCPEWGVETYGIVRVPMYIMSDGYRGLPQFLANRFAGNARQQFTETVKRRGIIPDTEIDKAIDACQSYTNS